MKANWNLLLWPPLLVFLVLLAVPQFLFISLSLHRDIGFGRISSDYSLANYIRFFTDSLYLESLKLTVAVSSWVVAVSIIFGFPAAYILARMTSRLSTVVLGLVLASSFVTIVVKVLGLVIIFGTDGPLNRSLMHLGIVSEPVKLIGSVPGVVVGLTHYTFAFTLIFLFSVIKTIPVSYEEAARIHGAGWFSVFTRVVIPLSLPGVISGALIIFNVSMGAFTSAALLGGGRILTLPVFMQRSILLETKYAMGATMGAILLVATLLINLLMAYVTTRSANIRNQLA